MIMIDMDRRRGLADRAETALVFEHQIRVSGTDAVAPLEVVRAGATDALKRGSAARIVAGLAVRVPPALVPF